MLFCMSLWKAGQIKCGRRLCILFLTGNEFWEPLYLLRFTGVTPLVAVRPMRLRACTGVLQTLSIDSSSPALQQTYIPSDRSYSPVHNELSPRSIFIHCGLSYRQQQIRMHKRWRVNLNSTCTVYIINSSVCDVCLSDVSYLEVVKNKHYTR